MGQHTSAQIRGKPLRAMQKTQRSPKLVPCLYNNSSFQKVRTKLRLKSPTYSGTDSLSQQAMSNTEPTSFMDFCGKQLQSHHQLCSEAALTTTAMCFNFQTQNMGLQAAGSWLEKTNPWHLHRPAQTTPPVLSIFHSGINISDFFFPC